MSSNPQLDQPPYVSDEVLDARYFKALDRFDIRFAPTMWVYDNVRAGSNVLHLGCGPGLLALLKRKDVNLIGADASGESAQTARRNGYDATFQTEFLSLPFADKTFDYVVSFDALNRLDARKQDEAASEIKRVLRKGGVTLHSIQCDEVSKDTDHVARFLKYFQHVAIEPRFGLCESVEDFLDEAEESGLKLESDFLGYLRDLSFKERRAFDLAMGYVFSKLSDLDIHLPPGSSHIFLKASGVPLGPFYHEHRDRRALFSLNGGDSAENSLCLDRGRGAVFDDGWYEPTFLPPIARWMGKRARIRFQADKPEEISLDLTTHMSDLLEQPLEVELLLNGVRLCEFTLYKQGWLQLPVSVPEEVSAKAKGEFELELRASRTFQQPDDDRDLSVAVCNIEVRGQNHLR
ncbi:MAG: class I SAM-dependent methyltransferase [Pyrinomonadaceae bacterium]